MYDVSGYVLEGSALTYYRDRFRSTHAQLYFAVGVVLLLLYIFQSVIIKIILNYLCKCLSCDCCRRHAQDFAVKDSRRNKENFSEDILLEFEISNLTELYKRSIRDLNAYEDLLTTANFGKMLKPAHAAAFSKEVQEKTCIDCHSEHHGLNFDLDRFDQEKFNHNLSGYELKGAHVQVDCKDCHKPDLIQDPKIRKLEGTFYHDRATFLYKRHPSIIFIP